MSSSNSPLRIVGSLAVLAIVGVGVAYGATQLPIASGTESAAPAGPASAETIQHGAYVAVAGDCVACHTAPGGKPFAGGLPLATPIGVIYSTNITPDPTTGLGHYSYAAFERAVRHGVRADGATLYPAMPYPSYARLTDEDVQALYAYFTQGVQPVTQPAKPSEIAWPLSIRWPLTYWRWLFAPAVGPAPAASDDPVRDRGAYLAEGPAHCGTCHTPRGITLAEKALTAHDGNAYLAGGAVVDAYVATSLRGDAGTGLDGWSEAEIVQFLKTGRTAHSAAFGGMADVVAHSTQNMTDADLAAIAHFLKQLPAAKQEARFVADPAAATALHAGDTSARGALDYLNNCAACHMSSGSGYVDTFPALAGNPVVTSEDPSSLIHIVLAGGTIPATQTAPTHFTMPPFAGRMTDQEVADVVTFIRANWGNKASAVDAATVGKLRAAIKAPAVERGPVKDTITP
jgi:mono/diheme cytochrome c family protein